MLLVLSFWQASAYRFDRQEGGLVTPFNDNSDAEATADEAELKAHQAAGRAVSEKASGGAAKPAAVEPALFGMQAGTSGISRQDHKAVKPVQAKRESALINQTTESSGCACRPFSTDQLLLS